MKKFIRLFLIHVAMFWLINISIGYVLQWRFREWEAKGIYFEPLRWKEFYKIPENSIDIIYLGSSHAYRSINPFIIDSLLDRTSFNFGTSGQSMRTSYHLLKNILEKQRPSTVVLETYFYALEQQDQLVNAGFNFPYINWSYSKFEFWYDGFSFKDKCIMLFVPTYRYRNEWKYVGRRLLGLGKATARGEYAGRGFVHNSDKVKLSRLTKKNQFDNYQFVESEEVKSNLDYLQRIITYCRENRIKLILVTTPIPRITYNKLKSPEKIDSVISDVAIKNDIPYYNFLDATKLSLVDTVHFFDNNHLNFEGANVFTNKVVLDVLKSEGL